MNKLQYSHNTIKVCPKDCSAHILVTILCRFISIDKIEKYYTHYLHLVMLIEELFIDEVAA